MLSNRRAGEPTPGSPIQLKPRRIDSTHRSSSNNTPPSRRRSLHQIQSRQWRPASNSDAPIAASPGAPIGEKKGRGRRRSHDSKDSCSRYHGSEYSLKMNKKKNKKTKQNKTKTGKPKIPTIQDATLSATIRWRIAPSRAGDGCDTGGCHTPPQLVEGW